MKKNTIPIFWDFHNTHFRIVYHIISMNPTEGGRKIFDWYGGTIIDAINNLLQAEKTTPAWRIVLEEFVEGLENPDNLVSLPRM